MSEPRILELEKELNSEIEKARTNMSIYTTSEQQYSHTGNNIYLQEPLRFQGSRGKTNDKLTFENNGIKIGAGINHINIKASVGIAHSENDGRAVFLYVRKNGVTFSTYINRMREANQTYHMTVYVDYMSVEEGDLIQLYVAMDNSNFKTDGGTTNQMTVQVVD